MNKTVSITKVSKKGTIHIPTELMTELKLSEGDKILWKLMGNKAVIEKLSE
ncbi:MAG: AbrB/MazE/SpoVT family DNA-binding domain-containing protein [Candidatus Bathyarchaeota archaeon]|nr:AbrB/MazE/SpoVT family DNA-binding domain-containing protein [Candidatus Bathyarchaeum sp.]